MFLTRLIFAVSVNQSSNGIKSYNRRSVYFICLVPVMGGLLFGYDRVAIEGARPFYGLHLDIADVPVMQGLAMSVALLSCSIGIMVAGMMADRYGRRPLLIISAFTFLSSAYAAGAFSAFSWFLAVRLLGGIGIGTASGLPPIYIAEVAPASIRGKLVSLNQLTIVPGILSAQTTNWLIAEPIPTDFSPVDICASWNGQVGWRWMLWAAVFPAAIFLLLVCLIPESPRWLAIKGRGGRVRNAFSKIGGDDYAGQELRSVEETSSSKSGGGLQLLFSRPFRKVLILGIIAAVFQQWCSTNVIFSYAQEIFQSAGYSLGDILLNIMVTDVTNVVSTFVAIYIVERLGRHALMLLGVGGLAGIYLILGTCYFSEVSGFLMVVLVVLVTAYYTMSLGSITWVLLAEIFPSRVRATAMVTCTFVLWVGNFTLTYTFPLLNNFLGSSGTSWTHTVIRAIDYLFFFRASPETKDKLLEALEKDLIK